MVDDWRKVSGTVKLHLGQTVLVGVDHAFYTCTEGIRWVKVDGKLVAHLHCRRDLGSKSKSREHLVTVIVLDDTTHCPDSSQVFIVALWVDVMEGLGRVGIPVGACEINSNSEVNLTAAHDVIQKGILLHYLAFFYNDDTRVFVSFLLLFLLTIAAFKLGCICL